MMMSSPAPPSVSRPESAPSTSPWSFSEPGTCVSSHLLSSGSSATAMERAMPAPHQPAAGCHPPPHWGSTPQKLP